MIDHTGAIPANVVYEFPTNHVEAVVVTDVDGNEAIYLDGELAGEFDTLYACEIAIITEGKTIRLSHLTVSLPDGVFDFPKTYLECLQWRNDR